MTEEEETTWIERGWTLQEVTAPKRSMVLFKWEHGSGSWEGYKGGIKGTVTEVIQKESAMMPLREMLAACEYPQALGWRSADGLEERDDISPVILEDLPGRCAGRDHSLVVWTQKMQERRHMQYGKTRSGELRRVQSTWC